MELNTIGLVEHLQSQFLQIQHGKPCHMSTKLYMCAAPELSHMSQAIETQRQHSETEILIPYTADEEFHTCIIATYYAQV